MGIVIPPTGLPRLKSLRTDIGMLDSVTQSQKPPVLDSVHGILDHNLAFLSGPSFRYLSRLEVSTIFQESDLEVITDACGRTLRWLAISACPKFELVSSTLVVFHV